MLFSHFLLLLVSLRASNIEIVEYLKLIIHQLKLMFLYIGRAKKKLETALPECAKKKAKLLGEQISLLSPSKRDIALTECGSVESPAQSVSMTFKPRNKLPDATVHAVKEFYLSEKIS